MNHTDSPTSITKRRNLPKGCKQRFQPKALSFNQNFGHKKKTHLRKYTGVALPSCGSFLFSASSLEGNRKRRAITVYKV